ncbi:hypothetical protein HAX54_006886 [Datura stramonium]|uniref:Uncharacterized protein n=1 Tax=Datura stramonium TaxID=4076 RepID=A0ABS8WYE3_DATST|nr:hypothetical protein [Datura stramonium]
MVCISEATITRMLYGPNFIPPVNTAEFDYQMKEWHEQHRWLAQVKIDGQLFWLTNSKERIVKLTLTFVAKFWWAMYDLEKSKYESRYDLKLHKPIPEVFRPSGQTVRAAEITTKPAGEATGAELVCHAAPIPTSTPSTYGAIATQLASSNSAPRVEGHVTAAIVSSKSQTFITLPLATEAAPPDLLSATNTTYATAEIPVITLPQTVVPNSGA